MGVSEHRARSFRKLRIGIITVSSTRSLAEDRSGAWIKSCAEKEGHQVVLYDIVKDNEEDIRFNVVTAIQDHGPDAMILSGGTGITEKDVTIEAVTPLFRKTLTAFSTLFTMLSFEEIDTAAILSRSVAGIAADTVVFCLPGSLNACKLACRSIIFPELEHILKHIKDR